PLSILTTCHTPREHFHAEPPQLHPRERPRPVGRRTGRPRRLQPHEHRWRRHRRQRRRRGRPAQPSPGRREDHRRLRGWGPVQLRRGRRAPGSDRRHAPRDLRRAGHRHRRGKLTHWNSLIPGLNAEQFDPVSAGMSNLPHRCAQAALREPEFQYTTALMVPTGNPEGLENMQSFVDSGLTVATMSGAIESSYAESLGLDSIEVGGPQDGVDALKAGNAAAFALTAISLNWL